MTTRFDSCDDGQLRRLLDGADVQTAVAEHLESCSRCQSRLAELAGSADQWHEARQLLTADRADSADAEYSAEARERSWSGSVYGARTAAWTESMARQLLAPPSHPEMLGRLGRYEVERLIGSGGYGIVFKAFDTELNRPVAIKVLAPHLAGSGAARQRFAREARAAAAVVHEHVVAIHNVESDGAAPFLVMHFVAGESLQARIDRQGPLALREILRIAHQTAAGLAAAHAQGLVHRDVKPSNILLEEGVERALLTDFGLARAADDASLTHTGYLPGTPHYMSPEQARGDVLDARSDLFSLGSVMYAMCTGRPPFRADTSFGVLRRITDTQPRPIREVNPDIPAWLAMLVEKLLAKQPRDRFVTAAEVAAVLEQCLAHVQQPATVRLPDACKKHSSWRSAWVGTTSRRFVMQALIAVAATVFLGLVGSLAIYFGAAGKGRRPNNTDASHLSRASNDSSLDGLSPSALEWDEAGGEISSLKIRTEKLEQSVDRFWDRQPLSETTVNPPTPSSGDSETNP